MPVIQRNEVGGWHAQDYGMQVGKAIEYAVLDILTDKNQRFQSFELYKPYIQQGQVKKGFGFPFPNGHRELIERINHMIMNFCPEKGMYVFQPYMGASAPQHYQPAQPQGYQAPGGGYQAPGGNSYPPSATPVSPAPQPGWQPQPQPSHAPVPVAAPAQPQQTGGWQPPQGGNSGGGWQPR